MTQLYLLSIEYRAVADKLADMDIDPTTCADTLESISGPLEERATNIAFLVRNLEATAEAIKEAEAGMAARRKAIEARAERVREYILTCMQGAGVQRLETPHMVLCVRNNPPAVEVFDAAQVPEKFMRTPEPPPPAVDKKAVNEALKRGEDVPGAKFVQRQRLEMKT